MLYLFTGNSNFLIEEAVFKWKNQFVSKYGDFNFLRIKEIENLTPDFLASNLLTPGFLGQNKFIIIDLQNDYLTESLKDFFSSSFSKIPDTNLVLLVFPNPDKRTSFYKELEKNTEKREFNLNDENALFSIIESKYSGKITREAISLLIRYKAGNTEKIIQEIEKLLINFAVINKQEVEENIFPELEENIFQIIDDILSLKIKEAINKIRITTYEENIYLIYNSLLANLRVNLFILKLKKDGNSGLEISEILNLGNKAFLVNKSYKMDYEKLKKLFINLVNIDKKMKTGNMFGNEDEDFLLEIEKSLIA